MHVIVGNAPWKDDCIIMVIVKQSKHVQINTDLDFDTHPPGYLPAARNQRLSQG